MNHSSQKSTTSRVIAVGSINRDVTVTVDRFPDPGETLSDTSFTYDLGDKGANQAVVAVHSGIPVFLMGAIGTDSSGQRLQAELAPHGVDVTHPREVDGPSGTVLITVNSSDENMIILDAGANTTVTVEPTEASLFPAPADITVLQAEILTEANAEALAWTHPFGTRILLNLTSVRSTDATLTAYVDVLIVNETEAGLTPDIPAPTGPTKAIGVAWTPRGLSPKHVMATLGVDDVTWASGSEVGHPPALTLGEAVDITGAGDAYVGALAVAMALNKPLAETVVGGIRAGPIAVLAPGAALSYATLPRVTRA